MNTKIGPKNSLNLYQHYYVYTSQNAIRNGIHNFSTKRIIVIIFSIYQTNDTFRRVVLKLRTPRLTFSLGHQTKVVAGASAAETPSK